MMALQGSSALLPGSTPTGSYFDPRLGPVRFGRPKPSITVKDVREQARYPMVYSWGDMTNLRPADRGMDADMCFQLYGISTASGEQEPPITITANSSDPAASAAQAPSPLAAHEAKVAAKKKPKSAKSAKRDEKKKEKAERHNEKAERKKEKGKAKKERREMRE